MTRNFDVIIIGAGPAGSTAAEKLSGAGFKTLIIEKQKLPRDKPCAGIAPPRIYRLLGEIPEDVIERKFKGYHLFSPSGVELYSGFREEGLIVNRERFDSWLVGRARNAGAEVVDNLVVDDIIIEKNEIKINNEFRSEILVGADGANSLVRKCIGIGYGNFALGVQYTVEVPNKVIDGKIGGWFEVHYGLVNYGYGWVSPQDGRIKIGLGSTDNEFKKNSKQYLVQFLEHFKNKKEIKNLEIIDFQSALIPVDGPLDNPCSSNIVLVGDAAGFVNPLTGEGIYYAIRSAQLASDAVVRCGSNIEEECSSELGKIKLNTKLRDEVLSDADAMEHYVKRLKKLE